ncbi:ABC transporter ATP-binding protein [Aestuariivivens sediminis]|uniref:ABC transporter ATP-binding protein n=1 Tax=Aestuariivivens sediminis TaxID=2913557 RepID=UPI001F56A214|nr:ABC transporter ATP-binding protein [Aestuariivivens sediminis]
MKDHDDILVKVEGLSKKFCKDLKTSLWYGVKDLISNVRGNQHERLLRPKEFWAVKDVSFEVRRGECLGLIGHNGAGKSTLLKILNGLIMPDAGKVTIRGRVGALIELGVGFNPILSGRENIYNNGAILGFSRKEIDAKLEAIIAFAELEEFIDMPVQHYSSGMKVRLGFAVAAQMEPDVLIIDEVLAVGDLGFVLKCFKTIDNILPKTAVIFVSHSMPMVNRMCNQIILMDRGNSIFQGDDVAKAIDLYYMRFANNESGILFDDQSVVVEHVKILNARKYSHGISQLNWNDSLCINVKFQLLDLKEMPWVILLLFDKEQRPVAYLKQIELVKEDLQRDNYLNFKIIHEKINLSKGIYTVDLLICKAYTKEPYIRIKSALSFQVLHQEDVWPTFFLPTTYENINLD